MSDQTADVSDQTTDRMLADFADVILRVAREIEPHSADVIALTGTEATVMRWIDRNPGTSPSATALGTGLQRSNLSAALKSLAGKGMIARSPDPLDARTVRLAPTRLARENIDRLHAYWARRLRAAFGDDHVGVADAIAVLERVDAGLRPLP